MGAMGSYWKKKLLLGALLGLVLAGLTGCGALRGGLRSTAVVEIAIDPAAPDKVSVLWDPAATPVENTEVTLSQGGEVIVTVRFSTN